MFLGSEITYYLINLDNLLTSYSFTLIKPI